MRPRLPLLLFVALAFAATACGDDDADPGDAGADGSDPSDAGADAPADASEPPPWPHELPAATELGDRRGRRIARAIVHLHSPLSHDACDGEGWVDGGLADPVCLQHLRDAVCALRLDVVMLTDHAPHVNEVGFEQALWIDREAGDEPVMGAEGTPIANRMACEADRRVLVTVGSENALMPVSLRRHVVEGAGAAELEEAYDADGPDAVTSFREAGGVVLVPHTESRPIDYLRSVAIDGLEIYNLHANVDPTIRSEHLGLDSGSFVGELLRFTDERQGLEPDLAALAFLAENRNALDKWDTLLAEGEKVTGVGGCDAHENAFPQELADGERADGYRRMMRWMTNHLLVDEVSFDAASEALQRGRAYVAFEVFGTPVGFDFVADADGTIHEMGATAPVGATLRVRRPHLPAGHPADPAPVVTSRLLRSTASGAEELAAGEDEVLEHVATEPGVYRAEVRILPEHTRPYLGSRADALIAELPWVYSNPIRITATGPDGGVDGGVDAGADAGP